MRIEPKSMKIKEIAQNINKQYILPKFQRDFAWNSKQMKDLENAILNKDPIGVLTLYNKGSNYIIIDGQQRLTTIKKMWDNQKLKKFEYEIPIVFWYNEGGEDDKIADHFIAMNNLGTSLDKEDISLAHLSESKSLSWPKWFDGTQRDLINKMYEDRNDLIGIEQNYINLTILEAMWIIAKSINSFHNHDKNVMGNLTKTSKVSQKVKNKLVWIKRILSLIIFKTNNEMNHFDKPAKFEKQLLKKLNKIFKTKKSFDRFVQKLNNTFIRIQTKFNFINKIPTNPSLGTRNAINKIFSRDYIPIYIMRFIYVNQKLYEDNIIPSKLNQKLANYNIKPIDIIAFASRSPISAGGFQKWLSYIINTPEQLFYKKTTYSKESLYENIINTTNNEHEFSDLTKVIILWLVDKKLKYGINNKEEESYEFDHIVSKKYCKNSKINKYSRLANCDVVTKNENSDKSGELTTTYINKSRVNNVYKFKSKTAKRLIKKWKKRKNKIDSVEFEQFISNREQFIKEIIFKKIDG